mgnify:CR=1 FL=1
MYGLTPRSALLCPHMLQLAVNTALNIKAINRMLGAARRLASHFKRSTVPAEALRAKQAALQVVSKEKEKKEEATDGYPVTRSNV